MAFLTIEDKTAQISSCVAFPDVWNTYQSILVSNNHILLLGEKGKDGTFIVKSAQQL